MSTVSRRRPFSSVSRATGPMKKKFKRNGWTSKKSSLNSKVKMLLKSKESKWLDTKTQAPTSGLIVPLNNVPLGDDSVARDGRKIVMTSIQIRGAMFANLSTLPAAPLAP